MISNKQEPSIRACPLCGGRGYRLSMRTGDYRIVRCKNCGLTYLGNPVDQETLYECYHDLPNLNPEDYQFHSDQKNLAELYDINRQRIKRLGKLKSSGSLLDIGCGMGFFLKTAYAAGYQVEGVDISRNAAAFAKKKMGLSVSNQTLDELLESRKKYDLITLWHVLEHFTDPLDQLKKIHALLADGGCCIIEVPNWHSLKFILSGRQWQGGNHPDYHHTFFIRTTLVKILKAGGFQSVRSARLPYQREDQSAFYHLFKPWINQWSMGAFLCVAAFK